MADVPTESPDAWPRPHLFEVCEVNPKRPVIEMPETSLVTFVPMAAVDAETGEITQPQVRQLGAVRSGYTTFWVGDVIFAKITPCMENGKSAVVRSALTSVAFGSTEFHVLRPSPALMPEYLWHFVRQ